MAATRGALRVVGAMLAGLLAAAPATPQTPAQPTPRVARIGIVIAAGPSLFPGHKPENASVRVALLRGLRDHGWVEGRNLLVEMRFADGKYDRLPQLAQELAQLPVDVIFTGSDPVTRAAAKSVRSVPIVFALMSDPVAAGLVDSLARPGRNATGTSGFIPELTGKQLELLKEAMPGLRRVALLLNPDNPSSQDVLREAKAAADALGLQLHPVLLRDAAALDTAERSILNVRSQALLVSVDGVLRSVMQRRLGEFALAQRLPLVSAARCEGPGCVMSFGVDIDEHVRRAAHHVDRILRGAQPADLPVERATRFRLVFHLGVARTIGLAIPDKLLRIADEVVE